MSTETYYPNQPKPRVVRYGASNAMYGLGVIGAWFYFFAHVTTLWQGVIAFFQGIFWPAYMVFEGLKLLYKG